MTGCNGPTHRAKGQERPKKATGAGSALATVQGASALAKIAVLLRIVDNRVAAMKHEALPDRLLTSPEGAGALVALAPLEEALALAATRLGIEPETVDLRRRLLGPMHIIWADLVDMAPEYLEKRWGAHDVPDEWGEIRARLLEAVDEAISYLSPAVARKDRAP